MTESTYLVTWRTWQEQPVTTPWDFWFVSTGTAYKRRVNSTSSITVTEDAIAAAFHSHNAEFLDELESEFIQDVKLLAFVPASDVDSAQSQIQQLFADAEFDRTTPVDDHVQHQIITWISTLLETPHSVRT